MHLQIKMGYPVGADGRECLEESMLEIFEVLIIFCLDIWVLASQLYLVCDNSFICILVI